MDKYTPEPASEVPLAMGRFTAERHVVNLACQARALAAQFGMAARDICMLSAAFHAVACRLREAGADGEAQIALAPGPALHIVFRVAAPGPGIASLSGALEPLRGLLQDLTITAAPDGARIQASWPIPAGVPTPVPALSAIMPGETAGPVAAESLPGSVAADLASDPEYPASSALLLSEIEEASRAVVTLSAELAGQREQLEASRARAAMLQKRLNGRVGDVAANRAIEDFLSMLSHELRTPLNAMLGWARLLRMGYLDEAGTTRALDALERNARVQAQLVADILDASRMVTGQLQLDLRPVELAAIVDAAVDLVKPAADAKRIAIETSIRFRGELNGDSTRLQQVAINLLSNAVKFTPEGGRIRVSLASSGSAVTLTVSDTGQGIDQAFLPFVFERFRQGDTSATRSHGGLGLGLSIVRHIVELHGGRIEVASDGPGRGASFSVHLPG